jgi:hypothetical protein
MEKNMGTKSTVNSHKEFDLKVRGLVGEEMYSKLIVLGIKIGHIKKICLKIGKQKKDTFKVIFLDKCKLLIFRLEKLSAASLKYSSNKIKKIISKLFLLDSEKDGTFQLT